jgi:hypothetical protein
MWHCKCRTANPSLQTKGRWEQFLFNTGLQDEPYFRYFSYPDFLTPYPGIIQIRKYAEIHNLYDLQEHFAQISALTKKMRRTLPDTGEEAKYNG